MNHKGHKGQAVEVKELPPQPVLTIRFQVPPEQISAKLAEVLPAVHAYITEQGIAAAGQPFSRYHGVSGGVIDMEAGIATTAPASGKGDIKSGQLPGGPTAITWHVGPYEALQESHEALTTWVQQNGRTPSGGPWEVYVTDPGEEPDSSKWKTQIFLPLKN